VEDVENGKIFPLLNGTFEVNQDVPIVEIFFASSLENVKI
jgi:hypothetical protein